MSKVAMPEQKKSSLGAIGTIAGAIGGAFAGNPAAGAQLGNMAGGMAGQATTKPQAEGVEQSDMSGAMKRRQSKIFGEF